MAWLNLTGAAFSADLLSVAIAVFLAIAGIVVTAETLLSQLPQRLRSNMDRNCIRMDGSYSRRRAAIEYQSRQALRIELYVILAIPAAIAVAVLLAMFHFFPVTSLWQADPVRPVGESPPPQLVKAGIPIAFFAAAVLLACWYMTLSGYKRLLRRLQWKIDQRHKSYLRLDLDLK